MATHTIAMPPALLAWIEARVAEDGYVDPSDYICELIRRDRADLAWVRAKIDEGLASGVVDRDAFEVLDEIIAELNDDDA